MKKQPESTILSEFPSIANVLKENLVLYLHDHRKGMQSLKEGCGIRLGGKLPEAASKRVKKFLCCLESVEEPLGLVYCTPSKGTNDLKKDPLKMAPQHTTPPPHFTT